MGFCNFCNKKVGGISLVVSGVLFLALGVGINMLIPGMIIPVVDEITIPMNTDESMATFSSAGSSPFHDHLHIFNITNKEEWLNSGAKPHVTDNGPYSFQAFTTKAFTTSSPDGCTVDFTLNTTFENDLDESGPNVDIDNDIIYMLNPVMLGAAALFKGLTPGLMAGVMPGVFPQMLTKLIGFDLNIVGINDIVTKDKLADQFSKKAWTVAATGQDFAAAPGLVQYIVDYIATQPTNNQALIREALVKQFGAIPSKDMVLEPSEFFMNYPGKTIPVKFEDGREVVVTLPSTKEIWPDYVGFTKKEATTLLDYLGGKQLVKFHLSTLVTAIMMGLAGEPGMVDQFALMALNNVAEQAQFPAIAGTAMLLSGIGRAPCGNAVQGEIKTNCVATATALNVRNAVQFGKIWQITVLSDYLAALTKGTYPMLDSMNFGLVIKGTAKQWVWGFEAMEGAAIPGILVPGLSWRNQTLITGQCDRLQVQSWDRWGNKSYVDPRIWPNACPGLNTNDPIEAGLCEGIKIFGFSGEQFPRMETPVWLDAAPYANEYEVYITQVYRNLTIRYSGKDVVVKGITMNHFIIPDDILKKELYNNAELYDVTCDGLLEGVGMVESPDPSVNDTKMVFAGASFPHFLNADPKCSTDLVDGLNPNHEEHVSFLNIEPFSGTTMQTRKALQAFLMPKKELLSENHTPVTYVIAARGFTVSVFEGMMNVRYAPIPYYYDEQSSTLHDDLATAFASNLYPPLKSALAMVIVGPLVGLTMIGVGAFLIYKSMAEAKDKDDKFVVAESTLEMQNTFAEKKERI